jgi:hypothetical protein
VVKEAINPVKTVYLNNRQKLEQGCRAIIRQPQVLFSESHLQTKDGYLVEPLVVMVQAINHATEHREQIKSMLSVLGITPPSIDGWDYGEVTKALVPILT